MDIVHHAFIGGAGFVALAANDQELAGMAFVAGSVFPDLDVVFMVLGKRFYLRNHQGPTHSLILAPLYALLIILPAILFIGFEWPVCVAALLGLWLHILLDLTNTYGITLFWPIRLNRNCFDAVFFIDAITLSLTTAFYIQLLLFPTPAGIYIYAGLFTFYFLFKYRLHAKVVRELNCTYAIPGSGNPFTFFILTLDNGQAETFIYNALSRNKRDEKTYAPPDSKFVEMAKKSEVFRDMRHITKHFFIVDISEDESSIMITAQDLAVRNFGGRFGKTILKFDRTGRLIDEMAHI